MSKVECQIWRKNCEYYSSYFDEILFMFLGLYIIFLIRNRFKDKYAFLKLAVLDVFKFPFWINVRNLLKSFKILKDHPIYRKRHSRVVLSCLKIIKKKTFPLLIIACHPFCYGFKYDLIDSNMMFRAPYSVLFHKFRICCSVSFLNGMNSENMLQI